MSDTAKDETAPPEPRPEPIIVRMLAPFGRVFLDFLATVGKLSIFTGRALRHSVTAPFYWRLTLRQMIDIGYYSLPVVGMTAIFTGMVIPGFHDFLPKGPLRPSWCYP